MTSSEPQPETDAPAGRPVGVLAAVVIAALESVAMLAWTAGVVVAGLSSDQAAAVSPWVEGVLFLLFGVGIAQVARGLWSLRRWSRTPFVVVQMFGVVVGWTLLTGDGGAAVPVGAALAALAVGGIVAVMLPSSGRALVR